MDKLPHRKNATIALCVLVFSLLMIAGGAYSLSQSDSDVAADEDLDTTTLTPPPLAIESAAIESTATDNVSTTGSDTPPVALAAVETSDPPGDDSTASEPTDHALTASTEPTPSSSTPDVTEVSAETDVPVETDTSTETDTSAGNTAGVAGPTPTRTTTSTEPTSRSSTTTAAPVREQVAGNTPTTASSIRRSNDTATEDVNGGPSTTRPTRQATPTSQAPPPTTAPPTTAPAATLPPTPVQVAGQLFVDPTNVAARWASNNSSDPRAATIASEIGSQPLARWFGDWNGNVASDVADYVNRATALNAVPTLVAYNIPDRDCGQHSAGGAANFAQYDAWISAFATGLGNSAAIIILEPDALALNGCAGSDRNDALSNAVNTIKASCRSCSVYLDAGHSDWVAPADMADRLLDAGVLNADGFFTNVSNYNATVPEQAFGAQVLNALGNPSGLGQVIDTSRNGNGANGEWCDAAGRAIGNDPTLQTGSASVDAYLWIKVPGESDGCIASAGQFVPDRAFELANG